MLGDRSFVNRDGGAVISFDHGSTLEARLGIAMTRRIGVVALTLALSLTGCGDGDDDTAGGGPPPTAGVQPTSAPVERGHAEIADEALPAPDDTDAILAAFERMPPTLGRAARKGSDSSSVRYSGPAGEAGMEALEIRDIYGEDLTVEQAVRRTAADLSAAEGCGQAQLCRRGETSDGVAMVWGAPAGSILIAAVAPDWRTLAAVIDAWRLAAAG